MSLFISMCSTLSILVYSVSLSICFITTGKTGKMSLQYAGLSMLVYIFESVYGTAQVLLNLTYSPYALASVMMLFFNVVEIYLLGKIVYVIFEKNLSATFYIWLCIIIIANGLISPFSIDLSLLNFIAFNISVLIICGSYWDSFVRETDEVRCWETSKYGKIILILAVFSITSLAYSATHLCLFKKVPSNNYIRLYNNTFRLVISIWFIWFCQKEYEAQTSQKIEHAFYRQLDEPQIPATEELFSDQMTDLRAQYELTEREAEILRLILAGKSNQEISEDLFITVGTVKAHIHSIFGKLDVSKRSQLITKFWGTSQTNKS